MDPQSVIVGDRSATGAAIRKEGKDDCEDVFSLIEAAQ